MSLINEKIAALARRLDEAQAYTHDTTSLADDTEVDIVDAYRIQEAIIERRLSRGERTVGVKLGFTSRAKMAQMGVSNIIVGRLTDAMRIEDGGSVDLRRFIHPKIEPEVAYRIKNDVDIDDPDVDIVACVDAVAPGMEIIDSRYRNFRFTYTDVIADNTSAAAYVIGPWSPMQDVSDRAVSLIVGDETVNGTTAAILDDPVNALHALLDMCRQYRIPLQGGDVVLAGAATAAVPLTATGVRCEIAGLGAIRVRGIA